VDITIFLIGILRGGVQFGPFRTGASVSASGDYDDGDIGEIFDRGTKVLGENCLSAALSTTNPTCSPDANPGRRCEKPATNRLSYGTAIKDIYFTSLCFTLMF
jgi:hypothetical protein